MPAPNRPEHTEVESSSAEASENPSSGDFNIALSIPEQIEVKMVDASTLSDYEVWFFVSSSLLSFFTGFLVALIQEADPKAQFILKIVTGLFLLLLIGSLIMTFMKRHRLKKAGKTIYLKTSRAIAKP